MDNNRELKWKLLSSEYLFNDTWLHARKDRCVTPEGKIVDPYYVIEYPTWVTGLGLTIDEEVILVRQYRHALGEVCIELPGGCVDKNDKDFEAAVRREFLEETGYKFDKASYLGATSANPSTNSNLLHMFLLEGGKRVQTQQLDANEEIDVLVISFEEFKKMLFENVFVQSMHVTNIFYALTILGKIRIS
jgi:8-oxo-dGTP pyrophosphatase MutT (NUDIX family)